MGNYQVLPWPSPQTNTIVFTCKLNQCQRSFLRKSKRVPQAPRLILKSVRSFCTLHTDSIHRGAGQIMPPTRRVCFAAEMMGKPTLQEPVFLVEITCPQEAMSGVYSCMNMRRGCVFEENPREGTPLIVSRSYLPVAESFGFVSALRQQTSGQAFPQCVFDHWEN